MTSDLLQSNGPAATDAIAERARAGVIRAVVSIAAVEPETVTPNLALVADLGFDSLDMVEMVMLIEDDLGVSVPDDVSETIRTVGDAVDKVSQLLVTTSA